jgi:predicted O-methyltransferase YrrM
MDKFETLQQKRYTIIEGSCSREQRQFIINFCQTQNPPIRRVLEIGFNGGLSAAAFLDAHPDIHVVSFDLGEWPYVKDAKQLIDELFPGRHTLIIGDSTVTVPQFHSEESFDLAFVDGGHHTPVPDKDIANCLPLLRSNGYIIMDDYCEAYGKFGVIRAYDQAVQRGDIQTTKGPFLGQEGRGWVVGQKL